MTHPQPPPGIKIAINATVQIQVDEIWPDGDTPNPITADDVRLALEHDGPKPKVLMTWGLLDDATVTITVTSPYKPLHVDNVTDQHHTTAAWVPATGGI